MKTILSVVATFIATFVMAASCCAQSNGITDPQHLFSNLTSTPVICADETNCWRVTGTVAQSQFCTQDAESLPAGLVSIIITRFPPDFPATLQIVGTASVSPTDCTFTLVAHDFCIPTVDGCLKQDGNSNGLIRVANRLGGITAWDTCTGGPCPTTSLTNEPPAIAKAYVTNAGSNTVSVISTGSNSVVGTIPVGPNPVNVAVSPSGSRAYVTNAGSNSVSVIDTTTLSVVTTVKVGVNPVSVAITPDGTEVYVANGRSSSVSVINTGTNTVVTTIPVGFAPIKVAVSPDGTSVYVANSGSKSLSVISTATNTVIATVPVGLLPASVAIQ